MRLIITGAAGMLGHDVRRVAERAGHELVLPDLPKLDITDAAAVDAFFERTLAEFGSIDGVLNCAAWTDVDGAETREAEAHAVNADGAGNLARAAAELGTALLHISTDYVFDG